MKAYKVTLVYQVIANSEADAQIQVVRNPILNLTYLGCEEMYPIIEPEPRDFSDEEIPF